MKLTPSTQVPKDSVMGVSRWLYRNRRLAGLEADDVARAAGVGVATVWRYEAMCSGGKMRPMSRRTVLALVGAVVRLRRREAMRRERQTIIEGCVR